MIVSRRSDRYTTEMSAGTIVDSPRSKLPWGMRVALGIAPWILFTVFRFTLGVWLRRRFRLTISYDQQSASLRPPFVVLANHVNFWDPFLVAIPFRSPVHFIAADGNFRGRLMRVLMAIGGTIPKIKAKNDIESIRTLQRFVREGKIVGIFPEGQRSWDGTTREVLSGTPKLVRLLHAPVVSVRLRGGYLATPRWSKILRKGTVELMVTTVLTRTDLRTLGRSEITDRIAHSVSHDETIWQETTKQLFVSPHRAEHAEKALFLCPCCDSWDTLQSQGATVSCRHCGMTTWFAPSGTLYRTIPSGDGSRRTFRYHRFSSVSQWNRYQLERLQSDIASSTPSAIPLRVPSATFLTGFRSRVLYPRGSVSITVGRNAVVLEENTTGTRPGILEGLPTSADGVMEIPIDRITGVHVQYADQLEFYIGTKLFVFRMESFGHSAYRLEETILTLQKVSKVR